MDHHPGRRHKSELNQINQRRMKSTEVSGEWAVLALTTALA